MLYRGSKENDVNEGKWIGVGGKFEQGETAGECLSREVLEETGIRPSLFAFRGILYFRNDRMRTKRSICTLQIYPMRKPPVSDMTARRGPFGLWTTTVSSGLISGRETGSS